eukprot:2588474-Alexandrium_andersonii.AAC.1
MDICEWLRPVNQASLDVCTRRSRFEPGSIVVAPGRAWAVAPARHWSAFQVSADWRSTLMSR